MITVYTRYLELKLQAPTSTIYVMFKFVYFKNNNYKILYTKCIDKI